MRRFVDVTVAGLALLVLSPVLFVVGVLVRLFLGKPILFTQVRPGLHGVPFTIIKFRTMLDECDADGTLRPDEARITRFGEMLRRSSLDELPGLFNVLRGDMTLIGPRPLKMEYLPLYSAEQARRHDVRPGITGLAQVSGRNSISWEEKFALDVKYVDGHNVALDLWILWRTVVGVVRRDGISTDGYATAPRFTGAVESGSDVHV